MSLLQKTLRLEDKFLSKKIRPLRVVTALFLLNFYTPIPIVSLGASMYGDDAFNLKKHEIRVPTNEYVPFASLPASFTARDYLNIANSLVHAHEQRDDYCKEMVDGTMNAYRTLAALNLRPELEEDVRIAITVGTKKNPGHVWLQVKDNNIWADYETVTPTPPLSVDEVPVYSRASAVARAETDADGPAQFHSVPGTWFLLPTFGEWTQSVKNGGLVGMIMDSVRR